jgi:tyrosyl-tRNA synthetase
MELEKQLTIISENSLQLIGVEELKNRLESKIPLRVKWGADPSAPDLHLGHLVILNKLKQLQDLGHKIMFLIGDFTARIGDPTGRTEARKPMTDEQIKKNAKTYKEQVFKILDPKKTEVVYNSKWLDKMNMLEMLKLSAQYTVSRMLERNDFKERFDGEQDISIIEFLYPLLQGYDSVHLKADLEVGGSDQIFNLLMGRTLQQKYGQKPQSVLTLPLLLGTDGVRKMSKSYDNYIGFNEEPYIIFSKIMSLSDAMMQQYYQIFGVPGWDKKIHPKILKVALAKHFVTLFFGPAAASDAAEKFDKVFSKKELPEDIELKTVKKTELDPGGEIMLSKLLNLVDLTASNAAGRRAIKQGAVKINEEKVTDENFKVKVTDLEQAISVGKRKFIRVKLKEA